MTTNKLKALKAWCCGIAYQFPNRIIINRLEKSIELFIDTIPLANFYFYTIKEFSMGIKISTSAIMKG